MSRNIFVHAHIPKCGGVTFHRILGNNFGRAYSQDYGLLNDYQYNCQQFEKIIRAHPWLQCYSSHKVSLDLPFQLNNISLRAIVFVRNPIDRFISHYFYHRGSAANHVPAAKELQIKDYIDLALAQRNQIAYINGQVRFLCKDVNKAGLEKIQKLVDDGLVLLFPLERFNEACIILEKLYPNYFKDCSYYKRNVSTKDQVISSADKQSISQFVALDFELLQIAHTFPDNVINVHFPEERILNDTGKISRSGAEKEQLLKNHSIPQFTILNHLPKKS